MRRIDEGWIGYRLYFVGKWRRALKRKQEAFPQRYRFDEALSLSSVSALTDLFVDRYTGYASTDDYFEAYRLTGDSLADTEASVVYARDDPVIPAEHFEALPPSVAVTGLKHGGHCAFLTSPAQPSWVDDYLLAYFRRRLT
jgi:predicted alpha/beta-fold hydrolase